MEDGDGRSRCGSWHQRVERWEKFSGAIDLNIRPHFSDTCAPHHLLPLLDFWALRGGMSGPIMYAFWHTTVVPSPYSPLKRSYVFVFFGRYRPSPHAEERHINIPD